MSEQLQLPYEEITEVAGRSFLRDNFSPGRQLYKIELEKIKERDGFNKRIVYDGIDELAESIKNYGLKEPLVVDVLKNGTVYVEKGHRRLRALQKLQTAGDLSENHIECFVNGANVTEIDRLENIYLSNNLAIQLNLVEQAALVFQRKTCFGKISNDEIGKRLHMSRQKVDYLLKIGEAPDDVRHTILEKNMSLKDAMAFLDSIKGAQKEADKKELDANITPAAPLPEPEDTLKKEVEELAELDQQAIEYKKENDLQQILEVSDVIDVVPDEAAGLIGRKLSLDAIRDWQESFTDEDTGGTVGLERSEVVFKAGEIIGEDDVQVLFDSDVKTVTVYQKGKEPVAESVITVFPEEEKSKFDESREEIQWCQNVIGLADKLEAITNKFDIPDGAKKDVADVVKWMQTDLEKIRDWVSKNKKQNKAR
jgi:ParB/RepB/Spo0J family partition protein